jgi:hypothetical protein
MPPAVTVFAEFQLPNATTWFYFSLILAVALFFKFRRLLSIRNWDVVSLFLLVPGLLLLPEASRVGYVWLLAGSAYFFVRCLVDLVLVRRPALAPNLSPGGLSWLGAALAVCLGLVAARSPQGAPGQTVGKTTVGLAEVERRVENAAGDVAGRDTPDWVHRGLAMLCHLAVVAGLVVIGGRHFQDLHSGIAAAAFYLLLPYTALFVGQLQHVLPTALLVWAVVFYRRPVLAGALLGLASGSAYFPVMVLPVWLGFFRSRGSGRFAAAVAAAAGVTLVPVLVLLWREGDLAAQLKAAFSLPDWQAWKAPTTEGFWQGVRWVYRLPVFIAYLAFVVTTAFWPTPRNLAHVLALSATNLIGIQFWYADRGGVYVLWYLPLLVLLVFRPNLSDRVPPALSAGRGRAAAAAGRVVRWALRLASGPEPLVRVR